MDQESLAPPPIETSPGQEYGPECRPFQGIPGIESAGPNRLFAAWYSCREDDLDHYGEGPTNYVVLARSDDGGAAWLDPYLVVDPRGDVRAFDPCLWTDPLGRLWLFWAQSLGYWDGRAGVWAIRCDNPAADVPNWSAPQRLCHGIMMNKPTDLAEGTWLLPAAVWASKPGPGGPDFLAEVAGQRRPNVVASQDQGASWALRGGVDIAERAPDEHMLVELSDGRLWMLIRTRRGIGQSFSEDGGWSWSPGEDSALDGPDSRFHIRRLRSGRLLLVNHRMEPRDCRRQMDVTWLRRQRKDLCAWLSEDDGHTWTGGLLIDSRERVSYPDAAERSDGKIAVIYDWDRQGHGHILLTEISEDEILSSGTGTQPQPQVRVVSAAGPCGKGDRGI